MSETKAMWAVEGNYWKRGWEFLNAFATEEAALFEAQRMTNGLYPVWKYRIRVYVPAEKPSPILKMLKGSK